MKHRAIKTNYNDLKNRLLRAALALLLAASLLLPLGTARAEGKTLRVGWVPRDKISEVQDGVYSGYNYDILTELSKYTGWSYEFVTGDLAELSERLAAGEIDLMGTLLYSSERAQRFDYADMPYGNRYTMLFTTNESPLGAYDFGAWDGIRIGALADDAATAASLASLAKSTGFGYTLAAYADADTLLAALAAGAIDAAVADSHMPREGFRILADFAPTPFYFATTKGNDAVLHELNRALIKLDRESPYIERELYDKYFNVRFDYSLTKLEAETVERSKTAPITVGIIPSSAPACYWDEERGEYVGIFMEMLKAVSQKTGLQFDFVPLDLSLGAPVAQIKSGSPQLAAGVIKTPRFTDDKTLALSDVLLGDSLVLVGKKGEDFTEDAENKTIATVAGFQVAAEYLAEQFPLHKTASYATAEECLNAVKDGRAQAAIYTRTCINHMLQNPHYEALEAIPAYSREVDSCVVGLSGESGDLISIINKGLALISESERNSIIMNTTIMNPYRMTVGDLMYKYRLPLIVIALLLLAVIATLAALVSSKRRSQKRLQRAYEQEQAAHELETKALALAEQASAAKGSFMSRMSHEIRTPLNAVIGYNTIARNDLTEARTDAEHRQAEMKVMDCLTKSDIASRHLLTIINDVLDMSAIESGKILIAHERFDFKALISSLTTVFYSQARVKGVQLEVVSGSLTEEWFIGDQLRTNQILTNILSNAIKFTPGGGSVRLSIEQPEPEANPAYIRFTISDTGIGMTREYLRHIWTPFEQADSSISRRFGGTGLGLSITKNLVGLMDGTIKVESEPNVGSTFTVELTFEQSEQPVREEKPDFSDLNALVIDDDANTCDYMRLLLERCGVRCASATAGEEAVSLFAEAKEKGEPFNICLVDWRMPGMDGLETVKRIRALADAAMPIIVITAYDFSEIADEAAEMGVNMFLSKPLFQSSLFDLLANVTSRQSARRPDAQLKYDFGGARVLLAEDNAMNMEIAKRILEGASLAVDGAWNGQEAVAMFEAAPAGTYGAILMDVQMPVLDGHQATRAIRSSAHAEARTIPIIAMTADAFAENVAESRESGMNDHISKPIDVELLFETLARYIKNAG